MDVVAATFFNFRPDLVRRCAPEAWRRASPERILEARTDVLASRPWERLGEDASARLRRLVRPWSKRIVESGTFSAGPLSGG